MSTDSPSLMPYIATLVLGVLAFMTAPVGSGDVPFAAAVEMNSAISREPDEGMRSTAAMTASLSAAERLFGARAMPADSISYSVDAERKRIPLFFGFIEFDWDPNAPGGVPGFRSMP